MGNYIAFIDERGFQILPAAFTIYFARTLDDGSLVRADSWEG
jgi:hypothetical protein